MNTCIWFRQDLRLTDNSALLKAQADSLKHLISVYIITPKAWQKQAWADAKVDFILRQLKQLSANLAQFNIPLKLLRVPEFAGVPRAMTHFCLQHHVTKIYANRQLLLSEIQRDQKTAQALAKKNIALRLLDDLTVLPPECTKKQNGEPFKVFTPFKKNWLTTITPALYQADLTKLNKHPASSIPSDPIPDHLPTFKRCRHLENLWPASEPVAQQRLDKFYTTKIMHYTSQRDFPSLDGTSLLSPYLAHGVLSVRQCISQLETQLKAYDIQQLMQQPDIACWLTELIWREFYYTIAFHFPYVTQNKPFKLQTQKLKWSKNKRKFQAWCDGQTGFPLVDAAMRQLKQTAWMHNRLRMVTAMFLSKTLFIDWRWGETYFMRHLIDGDFAANNGGWQWSASTGTDAVPYFRIFNPTLQSQRFDPKGDFIRQYCPELRDCSNREIHNPSLTKRKQLKYPAPIVDYKSMRVKAMAAFKAL